MHYPASFKAVGEEMSTAISPSLEAFEFTRMEVWYGAEGLMGRGLCVGKHNAEIHSVRQSDNGKCSGSRRCPPPVPFRA